VPPTAPAGGLDRSDEPPWPIWTAPAAIVVGLVVGVLGSAVVAGIGAATGSSATSPAVSLVSDVVFDLGFVVTALYFASASGRGLPAPSVFGYRRISLWLGVGAFFAAGAGYLIVSSIYQSIVKLHGTDKLPTDLGITTSTAALIGAAIFVCVIAPICEEFFFRGFIFGALRKWHISIHGRQIGTWVAAIETGILFGLAHTGSAAAQYLIPLGFLGFVLCVVRWKTRSLYPCMALHSVNNSIALGYNELHWTAGEIFGLTAGALAVIAAVTLPLASLRAPASASRASAS
jgi:membrane protease YdiL (CAAX protease family)